MNMKKSMLVTLVMAFLMFTGSTCGFAQVTFVADTTKEGSLLVYPLVLTGHGLDTYIVINNGLNNWGDVNIKCYWEYKDGVMEDSFDAEDPCLLMGDTAFTLTNHNPAIFRASDGLSLDGTYSWAAPLGDGKKAALKCWAVDVADAVQISWNHLSGYAIIVDNNDPPQKTAMQYSATRFAANVVKFVNEDNMTFVDGFLVGNTCAPNFADNCVNNMALKGGVGGTWVPNASDCPKRPVGNPNPKYYTVGVRFPNPPDPSNPYGCVNAVNSEQLKKCYGDGSGPASLCELNNAVYDACPKYLTFDFLAEPSTPTSYDGFALNYIALLPCKENLLDDTVNESKTNLVFYVWNENEVKYTGMQHCAQCGYFGPLADLAPGHMNYFQAKYLHTSSGRFRVQGTANSRCGASTATSLVGMMSTKIMRLNGTGLNERDFVGTTPTYSGIANGSDSGYIKWTPMGGYYEGKERK
jgi:hypothetical protein